ncbi:DNA topoisomerase 1 [Geodia barretti]|uniref:DNA topoisomerase n=1 Tax=Geodia barretti TaxID=519541 RepID=A0AA35TKB1_GEOBA|nr:DNA topoisomerase 1 [Geodia barretti]
MGKDLVIVESPAKARTIGRFLGGKYDTKASMGHVRDIPKREMGVKVDDLSFVPKYRVMADKRKIVKEIADAAKSATTVYLATDPDREGEAISWHLIKAAKIDASKVQRVVFHEITDGAVKEAFAHPRDLDDNLIDAQQARRVLDRLVGYELSPVLWKKVRRGLSAGRVQSVALRLIVEREQEIEAFQTEEYWSIEAKLAPKPSRQVFSGSRAARRASRSRTKQRLLRFTGDLEGAGYRVISVRRRERRSKPSAPFITSTLQQEAWRKLRFTARRTMVVAQQLYEGVNVGTGGTTGLITYMRTDSTNVADSALREASAYVKEKFGASFVPKTARRYTKRVRGAQEAHEAIRPTSLFAEPEKVKNHLTPEQFRLYDLIWRRMVASQMNDAVFDATRVDIDAESVVSGSVLKFAGFRKVYMEGTDSSNGKPSEESRDLPPLEDGDALDFIALTPEQHFTQPPPRYTEATLIRTLEEEGIGRPSTYAPTLATVLDRDYARKAKGRFEPTKLGRAVTGLLIQHFPDVVDIGFTAKVEEQLDEIASGQRAWNPMLKEFYQPFNATVQEALEKAERVPSSEIDEESGEVCEKCDSPMVIKSGRFGRFLSCSGFPNCRNSKPLMERVGVECPKDGGDIVERRQRGKGGRKFYGCANYPDCDFTVNRKPLGQPCPECSGLLVEQGRDRCQCRECDYRGPVPEAVDAGELVEA